jgi:WD40 repeat protein
VLASAFALENARDIFVQQGARLRIIAGLERYPVEASYPLEPSGINSLAWMQSGVIVAAGNDKTHTIDPLSRIIHSVPAKFQGLNTRQHPTLSIVAKLNSQGHLSLFDAATREERTLADTQVVGQALSWCSSDSRVELFSDSRTEGRLLRWAWNEHEPSATTLWDVLLVPSRLAKARLKYKSIVAHESPAEIDAFDVHPRCGVIGLVADGFLMLKDMSGREIAKDQLRPDTRISRLRWSPDGRWLTATEQRDGESDVLLWEFTKGTLDRRGFDFPSHKVGITDSAWSPNSQHLATVSQDGILKTWDVPGTALETTYTASRGPVLAVAWSPSGNEVATGHADGSVKIWRTGSRISNEAFERAGRKSWVRYDRITIGHRGSTAVYGAFNLRDDQDVEITDAELIEFARRKIQTPLTSDECEDILGLPECRCPVLAPCHPPRPASPR